MRPSMCSGPGVVTGRPYVTPPPLRSAPHALAVFQDQSTEPGLYDCSPTSWRASRDGLVGLVGLSLKRNARKSLLYLTWGRPYGMSKQPCYPDYTTMQDKLQEGYCRCVCGAASLASPAVAWARARASLMLFPHSPFLGTATRRTPSTRT